MHRSKQHFYSLALDLGIVRPTDLVLVVEVAAYNSPAKNRGRKSGVRSHSVTRNRSRRPYSYGLLKDNQRTNADALKATVLGLVYVPSTCGVAVSA
jgi:hypothetical protein